jgi:uncharacterized protein (TIGR02268 family)
MFRPDSLAVMISLLLLGTGALAQAQGVKRWKRVERSVSVSAGTGEVHQTLRLAPHVVTTVLFDTDIDPKATDVQPLRGLFSHLEVHTRHLLIKPAVAIPGAGVPPLVVHFADASAPRRMVFTLTTDKTDMDSVVEVLRQRADAEHLEAELMVERARCNALEERLAAARRAAFPEGLAAALLSGAIGSMGVIRKTHFVDVLQQGVTARWLDTYRSNGWAALLMELHNPPGATPWVPGLARLTPMDAEGRPTGEVLELSVQMKEARLASGQRARAVVLWQTPEGGGPAAYAVEVLDAARRRGPRWKRVEF